MPERPRPDRRPRRRCRRGPKPMARDVRCHAFLAPGHPRVAGASRDPGPSDVRAVAGVAFPGKPNPDVPRAERDSGRCPAAQDSADVEHGVEPGDVPRKPPLVPGGGKPPPGLRPGDHCGDRVLGPAPAAEPSSPQGGVDVPAASGELLPAEVPGGPLREEAADAILVTLVPTSPFRPLGVSIPAGSCPGTQPVDAPLDMRREARRPPGSTAYLSEDPRGRNRRVRATRITPGSSKHASSMQKLQGHNLAGADHDPGRTSDRLPVLGGGLGDLGGVIRGRDDVDVAHGSQWPGPTRRHAGQSCPSRASMWRTERRRQRSRASPHRPSPPGSHAPCSADTPPSRAHGRRLNLPRGGIRGVHQPTPRPDCWEPPES